MKNTPLVLLQQRDFGQKINASFDFVIKNLGPLTKCVLLITGPSALLSGIAQGIFQSRLLKSGASQNALDNIYLYLSPSYFFVMLFSVITLFLCYAVISSFMVLYEQNGADSLITPAEVWKKIVENMSVAVVSQFLTLLLIVVGMLFFIIPGIYLAVCLQLSMMVVIREKLSATDSLRRSYELVRGKWWSTFGLIMIMSIIAGIIGIVFQFPILLVTILKTLGFGGDLANSDLLFILASVVSIVGSTLVQGLIWVAVGFQYYNLVERLDGSGLRTEIESLGSGDSARADYEHE